MHPYSLEELEAGQIICIDKPLTWTSFDVVAKLRNLLRIKKIGHAGTLDPLATGVLLLCTGKATKQIEQLQSGEKEYVAGIQLGFTTPSYDSETAPVPSLNESLPTQFEVLEALTNFVGVIEQVPPAYSAVKIQGKRAYDIARAGKVPELKARTVEIKKLELLAHKPEENFLELRIVCGKGTYIRSLAHDLGQKLGSGGYLKTLVRTRVGEHTLADASSLQQMQTLYPSIKSKLDTPLQ